MLQKKLNKKQRTVILKRKHNLKKLGNYFGGCFNSPGAIPINENYIPNNVVWKSSRWGTYVRARDGKL